MELWGLNMILHHEHRIHEFWKFMLLLQQYLSQENARYPTRTPYERANERQQFTRCRKLKTAPHSSAAFIFFKEKRITNPASRAICSAQEADGNRIAA